LALAADAAPGLLFLGALVVTRDTRLCTWVLVFASAAAMAVIYVVDRKIRPIPALTFGLALIFGTASLLLHRFDIIQMKMTLVDGLLGSALFIGLAIKKNPLKLLLGSGFTLSDRAWAVLAMRYGTFWLACAVGNEVVRRTQSTDVWTNFRLGVYFAALLFTAAQVPFILKHNRQSGEVESPPPPDLGV
jgi:intracellular septation protein